VRGLAAPGIAHWPCERQGWASCEQACDPHCDELGLRTIPSIRLERSLRSGTDLDARPLQPLWVKERKRPSPSTMRATRARP
jgi:hypothetical protein